MMKSGVVNFIEKPFDPNRLIESVRGALSALQDTRTRRARHKELRARYRLLTERERQVFAELVLGRTNKEISNKYNASVRTVEVHRASATAPRRRVFIIAFERRTFATALGIRNRLGARMFFLAPKA